MFEFMSNLFKRHYDIVIWTMLIVVLALGFVAIANGNLTKILLIIGLVIWVLGFAIIVIINGSVNDINDVLLEVSQLKTEVQKLNTKLKTLDMEKVFDEKSGSYYYVNSNKSTWKCDNCGDHNSLELKACNKCGQAKK